MKKIICLYALLIRLYPREFRDEFADEMQNVFADTLADAAQRGNIVLIQICLQELCDLPGAILREHWRGRSIAMENKPRMSWLELLCAAIPFLLYLAFPIIEGLRLDWGAVVILFLLGTLFLLMIVGMFKGLPRWSLPAMGLLLAILNYVVFGIFGMSLLFLAVSNFMGLSKFLFPIVSDTMVQFFRAVFGSGLSYLGIVLMVLVIILGTALIKPFNPFFQRIRNDWTLFPFALYGVMPIVMLISFDEYHGSEPFEIGMGLILLAGLALYLRFNQPGPKLLVLGISITLAMAIEAIGKWILIPSQRWLEIIQPTTIEQTIQGEVTSTIQIWFWVMVAVFLPALLGLLPHKKQPTQSAADT